MLSVCIFVVLTITWSASCLNLHAGMIKKALVRASVASFLAISPLSSISPAWSTNEPPIPLERYFKAIEKEADSVEGESLIRLRADLEKGDWEDMKAFTKEFENGFRGTVLKGAWKQMEGERKRKGIEISNAFTFDLIGVNKAARNGDREEAARRIDMAQQDLRDFLQLKEMAPE